MNRPVGRDEDQTPAPRSVRSRRRTDTTARRSPSCTGIATYCSSRGRAKRLSGAHTSEGARFLERIGRRSIGPQRLPRRSNLSIATPFATLPERSDHRIETRRNEVDVPAEDIDSYVIALDSGRPFRGLDLLQFYPARLVVSWGRSSKCTTDGRAEGGSTPPTATSEASEVLTRPSTAGMLLCRSARSMPFDHLNRIGLDKTVLAGLCSSRMLTIARTHPYRVPVRSLDGG